MEMNSELTNLTVRQAHSTGNAHLATDADTLLCGTSAKRTSLVRLAAAKAEQYVTCSKCRTLVGWPTLAGSYRKRSTSGLDSSAWGANRGR